MFAVPGWSLSTDKLKTEQASASTGPSKKRKRPGRPVATEVTSSNVADLWGSVVEGKKADSTKNSQPGKRQKKSAGEGAQSTDRKGEEQQTEAEPAATAQSPLEQEKREGDKKAKKSKREKQKEQRKNNGGKNAQKTPVADDTSKSPSSASKPSAIAKAPPVLPPAPPKLTPLQASMREKLISARFRHLNETLYTRPSEEAYSMFDESPEMFSEYHEGFRRQVKVWPENPVDSFLQDIRDRGRIKTPGRGRPGASAPSELSKTPLPRTAGTCIIADLGCGDARLAESMQSDQAKLRVDVKSFDLQSPSPLVTKADIANLPLEDGSVNVAVFCLALMGTNWIDFIEEAYRILHWKGELWIAEIKSRFGPVRGKNARVIHSVGNRKKAGKGSKDAGKQEANDEDLAVEVDGVDDRRRETDVSAFIEALNKRGFVLQGERGTAVDLSNKMFVKMHFIKGASPTKGKDAKPQESAGKGKKGFGRRANELEDEEEADANEASILKPCVYKIR
ncbi:25S rRNA (Adenine(645)-N(1))-methyltransferase [Paramyrothecium foliicola]|nr:25S rRNA (Adenine(645)-N(1))-methyltransferase [Paramyrothecium foliicola]